MIGSGLRLLKAIHNQEEYHGDPYFKNFLVVGNKVLDESKVYTTGLQYARNSPNPKITDLQIFLANTLLQLKSPNNTLKEIDPEDVYRLARSTYGILPRSSLKLKDKLFYSRRFSMGGRFFQFFERGY